MNSSLALNVLAAAVAVGSLGLALVALHGMRLWRARFDALEISVAALRREVELVASISARTGRRVQRVEHDYSQVADRVDVVESRPPGAAGTAALDQAIEWARGGADTQKLAEQFGLSSGEAELVARLHGGKKSA